jgi:hypothetical protein
VNHPMGPPALVICAVADHLALAAPPAAYLGFLLRVLRTRAAGCPRSRTPRCVRPRALTGGAVQISGCVGNTNPGCSRRERGRKIRRDFLRAGAWRISPHCPQINPMVPLRVRSREFRIGGRCDRRRRLRNFWRISLNRARISPRARDRFCRRFFRRAGRSGSLHPAPIQTPGYPPAHAWPNLETGGWGPTEIRRPAEDPTPPSRVFPGGFQKFCQTQRREVFGLRARLIAL